MYFNVILPLNLSQKFTYFSEEQIQIGNYIKVNFNNKICIALVVEIIENQLSKKYEIKSIIKKINITPTTKNFINFLNWAAYYYILPIGIVFKASILKKIEEQQCFKLIKDASEVKNKAQKKAIEIFQKERIIAFYILKENNIRQSTVNKMIEEGVIKCSQEKHIQNTQQKFNEIKLNKEQQEVQLKAQKYLKNFNTLLLDGVTGSGKTACYLNLIIEIFNKEKEAQALIILPEISLTKYILSKISSYFQQKIEIIEWHSALSQNKRIINWHKITDGTAKLIIGARSAVFLPYKNLKIIVIDEEHDSSFKQDSGEFIYNAKNLAIVRAKIFDIPIILSSATPSLESLYNAEIGKFIHLELKNRFGGAKLPQVSIIDMKSEKKISKYISENLYNNLKNNLEDKKQSIIFLNKRGYAHLLLCTACGYRLKCYNCSCWMVLHKNKNKLLCHLCNSSVEVPKKCKNCNEKKLIPYGAGIERIFEEIKSLFPSAKIIAISSDTQSIEKFTAIENNEVDIIIGTQIISKGYDFANLTLLAVIDADSSYYGPDFRSNEKIFQMMQQIIGRVGRRKENIGTAILQTYNAKSFLIESLVKNDKNLFYESELLNRKNEFMPPFSRLVSIIISSYIIDEALNFSKEFAKNIIRNEYIQIFGPAPAPIEFLNNRYRYKFLIIYKKHYKIQNYLKTLIKSAKPSSKIKLQIDIDPINFL